MTNEEIAETLGEHCFNPCRNKKDFAVQLFIEKTVLPSGTEGYTSETMQRFIMEYLNEMEVAID